MTTIHIRDYSNPRTGNEYGNSWIAVGNHNLCDVSENNLSYYATCPLTGITLIVRKGTNEAGWIKRHLEEEGYSALNSYITSVVLKNALVSEVRAAIENMTQQAYRDGKKAAKAEMRAALGL